MKVPSLICRSLYGHGIHAVCEGLSLIAIAPYAKSPAMCHFSLQSKVPDILVSKENFSLQAHFQKAAFSPRLFSDYERMLADCAICDQLHPTLPILKRSYHTAFPLVFSLSVPPRTKIASLGAMHKDTNVLQLQLEHHEKSLFFAWCAEGIWEDGFFSIPASSGEVYFFFAKETELPAFVKHIGSFPCADSVDSLPISAHEQCLSLLSARTDALAVEDPSHAWDLQSNVLLSLCRLDATFAKPIADRLYQQLSQAQNDRETDWGAIPLAVLAWQSYCDRFDCAQPTPIWQLELLKEAGKRLLCGMMPFARCDALPFPFCEHGSLMRTVQWVAAVKSLLSRKEEKDFSERLFLAQKADFVLKQLPIHFCKDGQWHASCADRANRLRKPKLRFDVCPICYGCMEDATPKMLQYHPTLQSYLCPRCAQLPDCTLPSARLCDAFDTFSYCEMPQSDFCFCKGTLCRAVEKAYYQCCEENLQVLFDLLSHESIDTLPSDALAHLAELLWKIEE